jgi:pilus assembly protein FimV
LCWRFLASKDFKSNYMSGTQYVRKLATAAAVSLALASGGAFGLGLGDIEMRSALNQPMQAEIRLTAVKSGELEGMIVQLASADAFARAGIERSSVLTDLSFSVDRSGPVPVIRISSTRPVVEPFLNFLVEVDWPQGRMIREYTVLLDPPVFMTSTATDRNTASDQAVIVQRGAEALVVPTPIDRGLSVDGEIVELDLLSLADVELISPQELVGGQLFDGRGFQLDAFDSSSEGEIVSLTDLSAPNTAAIQQRSQSVTETVDGFEVEVLGGGEEVGNSNNGFTSESDGSTIVSLNDINSAGVVSSGDDSVSVRQGDTLYEIARSKAVGGASIQQMMMALLKANESSFINNNINLVKAGEILRVPGASEATQLNQAEALVAISEQNQLWRDYRDQLRSGSGARLASTVSSSESLTQETQPTRPLQEVELLVEEEANTDGLADGAQAILDIARDEIRDRAELKLVADSTSTSTAASATADATSLSETDRLGEVNRKLQLAREELSSTRLQSSDLADQASELVNTTENLDSLVELRQTGVANLEAQLADARRNAENTVDAVGSFVEGANDSSVDLIADASATVGEVVDSGNNALTEAGEDLGEVELFSEGDNQQALQADNTLNLQTEVPAPPVQTTAWYQNLLSQPVKLLIAGGALLGTLGLAALLLWRRRRSDDVDEETAFGDDIDFIDEYEAADLQAELSQDRFDNIDDFGEVSTGIFASSDFDEQDTSNSLSNLDSTGAKPEVADVDDMQDLEFGSELQSVAVAASNVDIDRDDTISEVDVYLNYGLHGQAEELLNKAVESQPNNPDYARKLLETYHGQGNVDKYLSAAKNFHARFGGEANPDWNKIAVDGAELIPDEPIFHSVVAKVAPPTPSFHKESVKLTDDDFLPADETVGGSINRSIDATNNDEYLASSNNAENGSDLKAPVVAASAAVAAGFASLTSKPDSVGLDVDETDLMDQSLDPAFAFDEADLEATGDFSQIADDFAAEAGDNVDFPSFDDTVALSASSENFLDATIADSDVLSEALTMDEIDGVIGSADDLTLDLDQLSGDLELDSAELMNPDLSDIDLPEMSFNVDFDNFDNFDNYDASDAVAGSASNDSGAMETMLDLAKAYIDMGDKDSASSALDEIVKSGNPAQVTEAEILLRNIS